MSLFYVFLGGGLGSVLRYAFGLYVPQLFQTSFPLATFLSNVLACGVLAITVLYLNNSGKDQDWLNQLLVIGFCGGFSTFSSFGADTIKLVNDGNIAIAALNVLISILVGFGLIFLLRVSD